MRQSVAAAIRSVGPREFKFVGATSQLGRDGHVIVPAGVRLGNFRRNPVILWQHMPDSPVARCITISVVDGELRGTGEFPPLGTSNLADMACGLVKAGTVSAVSIGFEPIDTEPLDPKRPHRGLRIMACDLLEVSLVSVPADTGAVITERQRRTSMLSADAVRCLRDAIDAHRTAISDHQKSMRGHERAARMVETLVDRGGISRTAVRSALAGHNRAMALHQRASEAHDDCLGELQDLLDRSRNPADNTKLVQTSSGTDESTGSAGGRSLSLAERRADLLALQGPIVGDGGAVGVAAIRDAEFLRAQAHCEAVARAGSAFSRDLSRAERQEEVRRLARPFG
jgi:HK97 family phage prohead protease